MSNSEGGGRHPIPSRDKVISFATFEILLRNSGLPACEPSASGRSGVLSKEFSITGRARLVARQVFGPIILHSVASTPHDRLRRVFRVVAVGERQLAQQEA